MGGLIAYVSADGKYLFSGNIYDLDTEVNLTAMRRNAARAKALASLREDQMIIFSPENPKMTVTVFTDIDCGYCRKFHSHIADLNKAGVRVRYMMFPRTGPGTESWRKAEEVWCSADRKEALTRAKRGEAIKAKDCGDAAITAAVRPGRGHSASKARRPSSRSRATISAVTSLPSSWSQAVQESQQAAAVSR